MLLGHKWSRSVEVQDVDNVNICQKRRALGQPPEKEFLKIFHHTLTSLRVVVIFLHMSDMPLRNTNDESLFVLKRLELNPNSRDFIYNIHISHPSIQLVF